jgi:hypothetical protein
MRGPVLQPALLRKTLGAWLIGTIPQLFHDEALLRLLQVTKAMLRLALR